MDCSFAFLADYAQPEQAKLHAIGIGWDTIYAQSVPVVHPFFAFVAQLRGTLAENGTKNITVRVIDADGKDVVPPNQQQAPFEIKAPNLTGNINIVMLFTGIQFPKYGAYAVHLLVQGREEATVPFRIAKAPMTG